MFMAHRRRPLEAAAAALGLAPVAVGADGVRGPAASNAAGEGRIVAWDLDSPGANVARVVDEVHELAARGLAVRRGRHGDLACLGAGSVCRGCARRDRRPALHQRELILRLGAVANRKLRIACIGGGTGLFTVLDALQDNCRTRCSRRS